jgi:hypothetical protein
MATNFNAATVVTPWRTASPMTHWLPTCSLQCGHGGYTVENGSRCNKCLARRLKRALRAGGRWRNKTLGNSWCLMAQLLQLIGVRPCERPENQKHGTNSELSKNCVTETVEARFHGLSARGDGNDEKAGTDHPAGRNKPRPKWEAWPKHSGPATGRSNSRETPPSPDWPRRRRLCAARGEIGATARCWRAPKPVAENIGWRAIDCQGSDAGVNCPIPRQRFGWRSMRFLAQEEFVVQIPGMCCPTQ